MQKDRKEAKAQESRDVLKGALPRDRGLRVGDRGFMQEAQVIMIVNDELLICENYYVTKDGLHHPEEVLVQWPTSDLKRGDIWRTKQRFEVKKQVVVEKEDGGERKYWMLIPLSAAEEKK